MYKFAYLSSTLALSAICALDTLVPCVPCALHTLVLSVFLWLVLPLCLFRKLISCYFFFFFWQILFICSCVLFDYQYFDYLYLFNNSTYDLFFFFFFLFLIFSYPFIYLINLLKITPLIMCNLFYILLVKFNKFYKPLKGSSNFLVKIAEHHLSYFDKKIPNPPFLGKNWWCIQKQQILSYIFMCFF